MANQKVNASDWIIKGIELFSEGGIDALNVEKTAKMLKCTKGSFYHHFKSREKYVDQILDFWYTERITLINTLNQLTSSPKEKLRSLIKSFFKNPKGLDFEFFLRKIAKSHHKAKRLLNSIERERLTYVAVLLEGAGVKTPDLKAELLYNYYLGWYERTKSSDRDEVDLSAEQTKISLLLDFDLNLL